MSEAQAIETDIKIDNGEPDHHPEGFDLEPEAVEATPETTIEVETEEVETEVKADAAIEIKVEAGEKPAPRRLSRTTKRIMKAKGGEADALARAEAAEAEVNLYKLRDQQAKQPVTEPDEDTFEGTDTEYKAAVRAYNQSEIKRIASEEAQTLVKQTLQQSNQVNVDSQQDGVIDAHYERAESMNVTNYSELEGSASDIIGDDFAKAIILSSDNAHRILASIGANPREAARIAQLAKSDPTRAFADALTFKIHPSLAPASPNALDPEQTVDNGSGMAAPKDEGPAGATYS
jgi:hypothetical protein